MRLGSESVGRLGLATLGIAGILGVFLAAHGWSVRNSGLPSVSLGTSQSAKASPTTSASTPASPTTPATPAPSSSSAGQRPLLSAQPFASSAYQIWPGTMSAAASQALTGLHVTVKQQGSALVVTADVIGQPAQPSRSYVGGVRVYIVEQGFGDDSGNSDYNLGDDGLVVTDAKGGIIQ